MGLNKAGRLEREVETLQARLKKCRAALDDLNHQISQCERQRENARRKYEEAVPRQDRKAMRKHGARLEKREEQLTRDYRKRKQLAGKCDQIEHTLIKKRKAYLLALFEGIFPKHKQEQLRALLESFSERKQEQLWKDVTALQEN